jgi:hypothetical protein
METGSYVSISSSAVGADHHALKVCAGLKEYLKKRVFGLWASVVARSKDFGLWASVFARSTSTAGSLQRSKTNVIFRSPKSQVLSPKSQIQSPSRAHCISRGNQRVHRRRSHRSGTIMWELKELASGISGLHYFCDARCREVNPSMEGSGCSGRLFGSIRSI